jgi:hypothetical protein
MSQPGVHSKSLSQKTNNKQINKKPKQNPLKYIMLSGVSQAQKNKGCMFSLICGR